MFFIKSSKKIFHANHIKIYEKKIENSYPYVVRKTQDNGIKGYIRESEKYLNDANTLSFAQDTFSAFYQKIPFFTGNKVKILYPKTKKFNEKIANFIISVFNVRLSQMTWGTGSTTKTIGEIDFKLPTKNKEIDFEFMEEFICDMNARYIAELNIRHTIELEAYLTATGLKNYELTEKEEFTLNQLNTIEWGEYKIENFADTSIVKNKLTKKNCNTGKYPVYSADVTNNGIIGYTEIPEFACEKKGKYILFGDHTRTMNIPNSNFSVCDNVKVLKIKNKYSQITTRALLFIFSIWKKNIVNLGYARHWKKARESKIFLPTKNKEIDFEFIENFISAIEKLVIKDVVKYAKKNKEIINQIIKK